MTSPTTLKTMCTELAGLDGQGEGYVSLLYHHCVILALHACTVCINFSALMYMQGHVYVPLSLCLFVSLSLCLFVCLSVCLN